MASPRQFVGFAAVDAAAALASPAESVGCCPHAVLEHLVVQLRTPSIRGSSMNCRPSVRGLRTRWCQRNGLGCGRAGLHPYAAGLNRVTVGPHLAGGVGPPGLRARLCRRSHFRCRTIRRGRRTAVLRLSVSVKQPQDLGGATLRPWITRGASQIRYPCFFPSLFVFTVGSCRAMLGSSPPTNADLENSTKLAKMVQQLCRRHELTERANRSCPNSIGVLSSAGFVVHTEIL
jgi:hypothetical protein